MIEDPEEVPASADEADTGGPGSAIERKEKARHGEETARAGKRRRLMVKKMGGRSASRRP